MSHAHDCRTCGGYWTCDECGEDQDAPCRDCLSVALVRCESALVSSETYAMQIARSNGDLRAALATVTAGRDEARAEVARLRALAFFTDAGPEPAPMATGDGDEQ